MDRYYYAQFTRASKLKKEGEDVVIFFDWRALVAFAEKKFEFSPSVAKYSTQFSKT
jgi:hypothetical protein